MAERVSRRVAVVGQEAAIFCTLHHEVDEFVLVIECSLLTREYCMPIAPVSLTEPNVCS